MAQIHSYPLRVRFADGEWATRVINAARSILNRPAFAEASFNDILGHLEAVIPSLLTGHLTSRIIFDRDSTGWAGYTDNLFIDELGLGCDLAATAYEHCVVGHGPSSQLVSTPNQPGPDARPSCSHTCSEHSYTNREVDLLIAAIRGDVRHQDRLVWDLHCLTRKLLDRLDDIRTDIENGSPLPVVPLPRKSPDCAQGSSLPVLETAKDIADDGLPPRGGD